MFHIWEGQETKDRTYWYSIPLLSITLDPQAIECGCSHLVWVFLLHLNLHGNNLRHAQSYDLYVIPNMVKLTIKIISHKSILSMGAVPVKQNQKKNSLHIRSSGLPVASFKGRNCFIFGSKFALPDK